MAVAALASPAGDKRRFRSLATSTPGNLFAVDQVPAFERLGRWGERVTVVRDGAIHTLAYSLATDPKRRHLSPDSLWEECLSKNRDLTREYQIVQLDFPSFFLPAGEVVFRVTENPVQLPDNPPQGVMMRHLEAMMAHPLAKFYLLEPVFTNEPSLRLYTATELRDEAAGDRRVSQQIARNFGWAHRAGKRTHELARRAASVALRATAWTIEQFARQFVVSHPAVTGHPHADELAALLADATLVELARRADGHGLDHDARRLRRALDELRWRTALDPVLCFEIENRPGELWFESHWFTGPDGQRFVHY